MNWCYCASGEFGKRVLKSCIALGIRPGKVLTLSDRKGGRGFKGVSVPVKSFCSDEGIWFREVFGKEELIGVISDFDLCVVCDFGIIFPREALNAVKCINIHPSLLPKWRGPAPIYWTILAGDKKTGASIIEMAAKVDSGPILLREAVEIDYDEDYEQVSSKLADLSARLLGKLLNLPVSEWSFSEQDDSKASYAGFINKAMARLDFENDSLDEIYRKIKAFAGSFGAFCFLGKKRFKIWKASVAFNKSGGVLGEIVDKDEESFFVQAKDGLLRVKIAQIEGKKRMKSNELLMGRLIELGQKLT